MNYFREDSFLLGLLALLVATGVIMMAISLQLAIDYTLQFSFTDEGERDLMIGRWVYFGVVALLTLLLFWVGWATCNSSPKLRSSLKKVTFSGC